MPYTLKTTWDHLSQKGEALSRQTVNLLDAAKNARAAWVQMQSDLLAEFARDSAHYLALGEAAVPANDAAVAAAWGTGCLLNDWKAAKVIDREFKTITPASYYDYRVLVNVRLKALCDFAGGTAATASDLAPILGKWSY